MQKNQVMILVLQLGEHKNTILHCSWRPQLLYLCRSPTQVMAPYPLNGSTFRIGNVI